MLTPPRKQEEVLHRRPLPEGAYVEHGSILNAHGRCAMQNSNPKTQLRAWQRAEHIALSRPIDRLSAPRRVRPVPANSRFKASPALFDLTTLRCIRNYYQAKTVTGQDMDSRGKAYGMLPPSMPSIRLHVPS